MEVLGEVMVAVVGKEAWLLAGGVDVQGSPCCLQRLYLST
jgi:hypothetical protein